MALIVQKYGGTSVGNVERIRDVAERVAKFKMLGHQVVVVRLRHVGRDQPPDRSGQADLRQPRPARAGRHDRHRRTGHHRPAGDGAQRHGLQGDELHRRAGRASSPTAPTPRRASSDIDATSMRRELDAGNIVIVAGFQGVTRRATSPRSGAAAPTPPASRWPRRSRPTSARSTPTSTASTPPTRASSPTRGSLRDHHLRGNAGNGEPRVQGAADPLGRVRRKVRRQASRAVSSMNDNPGTLVRSRKTHEHGSSRHPRRQPQPRPGQGHHRWTCRTSRASRLQIFKPDRRGHHRSST